MIGTLPGCWTLPPIIKFLELHAYSVRIKGLYALKLSMCSYSTTEQQYSVVAKQRTIVGFKQVGCGLTSTKNAHLWCSDSLYQLRDLCCQGPHEVWCMTLLPWYGAPLVNLISLLQQAGCRQYTHHSHPLLETSTHNQSFKFHTNW